MSTRRLAPALLVAGLFLFAVALIWPVLESGMMDEWSYVQTTQVLAQTGHIHYNGWSAVMPGWEFYIGAALLRIFGFSFAVLRFATVLEALGAVLLLQRAAVRAGLSQWNASLAVLAFALSPIFLVNSVVFLTDMPAVFTVVLCFYACLRAVQASTESSATRWICFAALSNGVLGSCRQLAWLGVIVMVPCTLWLLRRNWKTFIAGALSCLLSIAFMLWCLHWFSQQPYILPERLRATYDLQGFTKIAVAMLRVGLDVVLFLLPIALLFFMRLPRTGPRTRVWVSGVAVCMLGLLFWLHKQHQVDHWLAPYLIYPHVQPQSMENTFTSTAMPLRGPAPRPLSGHFQLSVTLLIACGLLGLLGFAGEGRWRQLPVSLREDSLPWRKLLVLTLPYCGAYLLSLLPRAAFFAAYDRYLLLLVPFLLLLLARLYQDFIEPRLPWLAAGFVTAMALYSVVTLHDAFAIYRAALALCNQLQAAGVPRTAINGGWEYDHYTQLLTGDIIYQAGIRMPDGSILPELHKVGADACSMVVPEWIPRVHPVYTLSYPGSTCPRVPGFAPVTFRTWLPPFRRTAYVVKYLPWKPGDAWSPPTYQ